MNTSIVVYDGFVSCLQDYFKPLKEMKKLASNCLSVSSMVSLPARVHNSVSSQLTSLTLSNSNLCGLGDLAIWYLRWKILV